MPQTAKPHARILIIDDDQDIWKAYRMVLKPDELPPDSSSAKISQLLSDAQDGASSLDEPCFDLAFASQGLEGYQMIEAAQGLERFAMAFVDVRMPPGWDGMETAVRIRQLDPNIELVIVTAYSDRSMEEIVRAVGHSDKLLFLRKPFDPEEVRQIARCLTSKWQIARKEAQQRAAQQLLEDQLRQAQKMESLGTLAGGIAHDFNNILSAIMGYADLARMRAKGNPDLQEDLHQLRKGADRAADLVRQILTFSRRQPSQNLPLQISLVIKEALKLLRATIPTTIEIHQELDSKATVLADPTQIHQLIMNLCTNAYHAMMEGGGVLSVTLSEKEIAPSILAREGLDPGRRYVALAVSDTGSGIDPQTIPRVFEPYFTTKEKGKGTGLGLAVVHGIVEGHHGRIRVDSQPELGTTFTVYLPMVEREAPPATESVPPPRSKSCERVMVVDDEAPIRDLAHKFLTEAGYRVATFTNAIEAWQELSQTPESWDLLITDQTMPGMTGEQLAAKVQAMRPELPILLCSGYMNIDQANMTGISAFLGKPLDRSALLRSVAKALDGVA